MAVARAPAASLYDRLRSTAPVTLTSPTSGELTLTVRPGADPFARAPVESPPLPPPSNGLNARPSQSRLASLIPSSPIGTRSRQFPLPPSPEPPTRSAKALGGLGVAYTTGGLDPTNGQSGRADTMPSFSRPPRSSHRASRPPTRDSSVLGHGGDVESNEDDDPEEAQVRSGEVVQPILNMTPRGRRTSGASASTVATTIARSHIVPPVPPLPRMRRSSLGASIKSSAPPRPPPMSSRPSLGTIYLVAGLPRDPAHWTLAEVDPAASPAFGPGAIQRRYRPEVLGTTIAGAPTSVRDASVLDGPRGKKAAKARKSSSHAPPTEPQIGKDETTRLQAKLLKLAFSREIEVIQSTIPPPSQVFHFNFTIQAGEDGSVGAGTTAWDMAISSRQSTTAREHEYTATCLLVYSHADAARSAAIRSTIEQGTARTTSAVSKAVRAAASGRKLGRSLEARLAGPRITNESMTSLVAPGGGRTAAESETDGGFGTDSEWDGAETSAKISYLPSGQPLWLPYVLVLVSRHAVPDLMADVLRLSWARHHADIAKHSATMRSFINTPAPGPGQMLRIPTSVDDPSTVFLARMPGLSLIDRPTVPCTIWPLFCALNVDNALTALEIALSPLGRVVFYSAHPALLSIAVAAFRHICESRGHWQGIVHASVHARDLRILSDDPGPYLLGFHSLMRPIANLAPEVCIVDLDVDRVECAKPFPGAISTGSVRARFRSKLEAAIGPVGPHRGPPLELREAFAGGRFRPWCAVEIDGVSGGSAERLTPPWNFDEARVLNAFDEVLSRRPSRGFRRLFVPTEPRKAEKLDPGALHVQALVRRQSTAFVDRRDLLEHRLFKLNARLAWLAAESIEWQHQTSVFSAFTAKLSSEARELKERLERERREARRLSSVVTEQAAAEQVLSRRLAETEQAKSEAADELMRVVAIRDQLQSAHDGLLSALRDESFLASALSSRADTDATSILSASSRPGTAQGHIDDGAGDDDELARQRTALVQTMRHLSERVGILTPPASIGGAAEKMGEEAGAQVSGTDDDDEDAYDTAGESRAGSPIADRKFVDPVGRPHARASRTKRVVAVAEEYED